MKTWDVIIVGGGIIGLSLSIALRKRGASVLVVERGEPGREASHAAAGMLVDCALETLAALQPLAAASARMYPEFAHELEVESGIKVDLRDQGAILFPALEHIRHPTLSSAALCPADLYELEPAVTKVPLHQEFDLKERDLGLDPQQFAMAVAEAASGMHPAFYLNERSVDPRALAAAAIKTAKNRAVDFSSGDQVTAVNVSDGRVSGVATTKTSFHAPKVVNCAGAWAGQFPPYCFPARPIKGQMLCVAGEHGLLRHVIRAPEVYLVPRSDGRILIGATVEEAGYDKRTIPETIQRMHQAALRLVPALRGAHVLEAWAGLRPGSPDNLPILGETATAGYFVAAGHFRDGILLAPVTAHVMAQVVSGVKPEYDISAFAASRFPN